MFVFNQNNLITVKTSHKNIQIKSCFVKDDINIYSSIELYIQRRKLVIWNEMTTEPNKYL